MSGFSSGEITVLVILAFILIGPERLPEVAAGLARLIKEAKAIATGARQKAREEFGDDLDKLKQYDPRQYDPRRILAQIWEEDPEAVTSAQATLIEKDNARATGVRQATTDSGEELSGEQTDALPPFDDQAT